MNNSYLVENSKVFVSDHSGIITKREYNDNIEQILIEENILESIQDEIKKMEQYDFNLSSKILITPKTPYVTLLCLGTFGLVILIPNNNINATMSLISDIVTGIILTSLGICGDTFRYKMKESQTKREERYAILKKLEEKQKSKIEKLEKENNENNIVSNIESIKLDHNKEKEMIDLMIQKLMDNTSPSNSTMKEEVPVKKLKR